MRRRIVAGLAEDQPATLRFAIDEARLSGLDLEVVHCAGYVNYGTRVMSKIYFDNWLEAAERVLGDARKSLAREFYPPRSHYRMSDHAPVDELLQASTEAAEIVVGSDNPSWFARMLGPAVARTLVFAAVCPVVVVPELAPSPPRAHGVVVGIAGIHSEEHVLRYAFEHATYRGSELCVLHALPIDARLGELATHHAAVAEALAGWSDKYPDVTVTQRFIEGNPSRVCARASMRAELVVIGQPRRSRIPFGFDEPISNALLEHATGPVAVVPDPLS